MKAEDKEDTYYKQRYGELEQENEFLKSQIVAPQRTIALLQSAQTAVGVKKIVPQPLPAHVPLPTAVPCVSTPTGQATTHAQPWAAARTGAFVAAVGETTTHAYPLAPDPQRSSPPASEAVSMQSSSYFARLRGEVNTFISKRNADVEREEWPSDARQKRASLGFRNTLKNMRSLNLRGGWCAWELIACSGAWSTLSMRARWWHWFWKQPNHEFGPNSFRQSYGPKKSSGPSMLRSACRICIGDSRDEAAFDDSVELRAKLTMIDNTCFKKVPTACQPHKEQREAERFKRDQKKLANFSTVPEFQAGLRASMSELQPLHQKQSDFTQAEHERMLAIASGVMITHDIADRSGD